MAARADVTHAPVRWDLGEIRALLLGHSRAGGAGLSSTKAADAPFHVMVRKISNRAALG
jgi:hypothetical protein